MTVDRKLLSRVEKLLRLASPTSGTTEAERTSAALEAAKLFSENGFLVAAKEAKQPRQSQPPQPRQYSPPTWTSPPRPRAPAWVKSYATEVALCADPSCDEPILEGEPVWKRFNGKIEYLHRNSDSTCQW